MTKHEPVLLREVLQMLSIRENGTYLDATAGGGGHSDAILSRLSDNGRLICTDRDETAVDTLTERFSDPRIIVRQARFSDLVETVKELGFESVDGVLFDLGVSMFQLKVLERGFSFESDERLDMRMDRRQLFTAWDIVNTYSEKEIANIIYEFSDERLSRRIARAIVTERKKRTIDTCRELADIIVKAYGKRGRIHPATRTFQALRIAVNDELNELRQGLKNAFKLMHSRGKVCVISYHSKEDRIVKHYLRDKAKSKECELITKKPVVPEREEINDNPAARSAKLRGAVKV
ncbi:MAG: 16S rRNA (cytosine(1402)-N(4))-methyltransferase RsmH [Nitrospirota bacterium]|nr:MAG: 16S rRNA (cytosine(1402)-N(4))-methyltransferase RsmH [Nitrospirota bacterium]